MSIKNRPIAWTVFSIAVISFPQWVGSIWSLFKEEPLVPFIVAKTGLKMPGFSPYWITVPLGILMFFFSY